MLDGAVEEKTHNHITEIENESPFCLSWICWIYFFYWRSLCRCDSTWPRHSNVCTLQHRFSGKNKKQNSDKWLVQMDKKLNENSRFYLVTIRQTHWRWCHFIAGHTFAQIMRACFRTAFITAVALQQSMSHDERIKSISTVKSSILLLIIIISNWFRYPYLLAIEYAFQWLGSCNSDHCNQYKSDENNAIHFVSHIARTNTVFGRCENVICPDNDLYGFTTSVNGKQCS